MPTATDFKSRGRARPTYYRTSAQPSDPFADFRSQAPETKAAIALAFSEAFHGVQKRLQLDDETVNVRIPAGAIRGSR